MISRCVGTVILILAGALLCAQNPNQAKKQEPKGPWMDKSLPADKRADLMLEQMTLDEKIQLVHGTGGWGLNAHPKSLGGAGYVPGIDRLGFPALQMTDGRSGVANTGNRGRYATALPSSLAAAASWDLQVAYDYGVLVGKETRDLGFNVSLGGTANLVREPRNGRNFECWGEDPILIGKMLGRELKGTQDQAVIGDINRYAVNDEETGRMVANAILDKRSMRETDLLAFEIAIKESDVGTVMCSYNKLNSDYACENSYLLNDVLKKAWAYKGWVMSDWGGTHSTVKAALAGHDQEQPGQAHFGDALKTAVEKGEVPLARLNDMVHRILRTAFASGVVDNPPSARPVNPFTGAEIAHSIAQQSIVLLKNASGQLPLRAGIKSIAVIGSHADVGVLSGGGSDQVDAAGGNAVPPPESANGSRRGPVWHPSSPLKAIRAMAPAANVKFDPGTDAASAAALAKSSDVAIVFVHQPTTEGRDVANLCLPGNQDEIVSKVAAANPHAIVVLETGGPVLMPWIEKVSAVVEAWYPGIRGGEAIADVLFGKVNPSAKLPLTFPKNESDLPHPILPGSTAAAEAPAASEGGTQRREPPPPFDINYSEGLKVGYKWFDAENKEPLFPFGFGLSYTSYAYSGLKTTPGQQTAVTFNVKNTGKRRGAEIAQVYVMLPPEAGEPFKRLVAWQKIELAPGESKTVTVAVDPYYLSIFSVDKNDFELVPGEYKVYAGASSRNTPLTGPMRIGPAR